MRRAMLLAALLGRAASAEILWRGDFETGDLSQWSGALNPALGERRNITVVEAPVFQGRRAAKIDLHPDDLFPNGHNRVELRYDARQTGEGQETYFSLRFLLPEHAKAHDDIAYWETQGPSYQQSMALYVDPSEEGTRLGFRTNLPAAREHWSGPLSAGAWHHIAMHVVWSQSPGRGRVSLWLDSHEVVHGAPAQTKPNGAGLFLQTGLHRDASRPFTESIYLDDAMEATSLEEVLVSRDPESADAESHCEYVLRRDIIVDYVSSRLGSNSQSVVTPERFHVSKARETDSSQRWPENL